MDTSGKAHEGWMAVIPLSVFVLVVMVMFGGPVAFMNVVSLWVADVASYVGHWIKDL